MWKKVLGLVAGMLAVVLLITGIMTAVNADNANTGATAPAGATAGPPPGLPPRKSGPRGRADIRFFSRRQSRASRTRTAIRLLPRRWTNRQCSPASDASWPRVPSFDEVRTR